MSQRAYAFAVALVVPPAGAVDPPTETPTEPAPSDAPEDPVERSRALHQQGAECLERGDIACTIARWEQAYVVLPRESEFAPIRARLLFDLAGAHMRAYTGSQTVMHLRRADILWTQYLEMAPADATEARKTAVSRRAEIAAMLRAGANQPPGPAAAIAQRPSLNNTDTGKKDRRFVGHALLGFSGVLLGAALVSDLALLMPVRTAIKLDNSAYDVGPELFLPYSLTVGSAVFAGLGANRLYRDNVARADAAGHARPRPRRPALAAALLASGVLLGLGTTLGGSSLTHKDSDAAGHAVAHGGFMVSTGLLLAGTVELARRLPGLERTRPPTNLPAMPHTWIGPGGAGIGLRGRF